MGKLSIYLAFFQREETGYFVKFPDLEGCATQGETLEEAILKANEVLGFYLEDFDLDNLPESSDIKNVTLPEDSFASIISVDMMEYHKKCCRRQLLISLSYTNKLPKWCKKRVQH